MEPWQLAQDPNLIPEQALSLLPIYPHLIAANPARSLWPLEQPDFEARAAHARTSPVQLLSALTLLSHWLERLHVFALLRVKHCCARAPSPIKEALQAMLAEDLSAVVGWCRFNKNEFGTNTVSRAWIQAAWHAAGSISGPVSTTTTISRLKDSCVFADSAAALEDNGRGVVKAAVVERATLIEQLLTAFGPAAPTEETVRGFLLSMDDLP